jgi:hypothetical protein
LETKKKFSRTTITKKPDVEEKNIYSEIELEEWKMNLKEREVALRKAIADELANRRTKIALEKEE